jgi:hypothetical protein
VQRGLLVGCLRRQLCLCFACLAQPATEASSSVHAWCGAGLPAVGESLSLDGSVRGRRGVGDVPLCGLIGKAGAI